MRCRMRCRICLEQSDTVSYYCDCKGEGAGTHKECLLKWIKTRHFENNVSPMQAIHCEICGARYKGASFINKIYIVKPAAYLAGITSFVQWLVFFGFLQYLLNSPEDPRQMHLRSSSYSLDSSSYISYVFETITKILNLYLSFIWAKYCYFYQLRFLPPGWQFQIKTTIFNIYPENSVVLLTIARMRVFLTMNWIISKKISEILIWNWRRTSLQQTHLVR